MSAQWINFINTGNPNGEDLPEWPEYTSNGDGVGVDLVIQAEGRGQNGSFVERDDWRLAGRLFLSEWARRRHV